jgi:hypothetical protein
LSDNPGDRETTDRDVVRGLADGLLSEAVSTWRENDPLPLGLMVEALEALAVEVTRLDHEVARLIDAHPELAVPTSQ